MKAYPKLRVGRAKKAVEGTWYAFPVPSVGLCLTTDGGNSSSFVSAASLAKTQDLRKDRWSRRDGRD